jgi:hypothetical protein
MDGVAAWNAGEPTFLEQLFLLFHGLGFSHLPAFTSTVYLFSALYACRL